MPTTNYFTMNGEIVGEQTTGQAQLDYVPDALGSVISTTDQSQTVQFSARYKPYGNLLSSTGYSPAFSWVGAQGYLQSAGQPHASHYARARIISVTEAVWATLDPLWPDEKAYAYVNSNPTLYADPTGLGLWPWQVGCAVISIRWDGHAIIDTHPTTAISIDKSKVVNYCAGCDTASTIGSATIDMRYIAAGWIPRVRGRIEKIELSCDLAGVVGDLLCKAAIDRILGNSVLGFYRGVLFRDWKASWFKKYPGKYVTVDLDTHVYIGVYACPRKSAGTGS